jgi:hypothetical protein
MQDAANFHTGYDDDEIRPSGQSTRTASQNGHYASLRDPFVGNQEQLEHQTQHTQRRSVSLAYPTPIPDLSPQESSRLCNITSSANVALLGYLICLSQCDKSTFERFHDLWLHGRPQGPVSCLASGIGHVTAPAWSMLDDLGPDRRQLLIPHLEEKRSKLILQATPDIGDRFHSIARNSVVGILSPGSVEFSTTSATSSTSGADRFHCPATDCHHKPEGYTKRGYCLNHIKTDHPTWTQDNSDWEDTIEVRPATIDTLKRKRRGPPAGSSKRNKACPVTPSDAVSRSGAMLPGIATGVPNVPQGDYSLTGFERDIGQASSQRNLSLQTHLYQAATEFTQMNDIPRYPGLESRQWIGDVGQRSTLQAPTTPTISVTPPYQSPWSVQTQPGPGLNNFMFDGSTLNHYGYSDGDGYGYPTHRRSSAPGG